MSHKGKARRSLTEKGIRSTSSAERVAAGRARGGRQPTAEEERLGMSLASPEDLAPRRAQQTQTLATAQDLSRSQTLARPADLAPRAAQLSQTLAPQADLQRDKTAFQAARESINKVLDAIIPRDTNPLLLALPLPKTLPKGSFASKAAGDAMVAAGAKAFATRLFKEKFAKEISRKAIVNTKTTRLTQNLLTRVILGNGKHPLIRATVIAGSISTIIGSYPWAEWAQGEARETINFAYNNAIRSGNPELIKTAMQESSDILDDEIWEQVARLMPGSNLAVGFRKKYEALKLQYAINNELAKDALVKIETGMSDADIWLERQKQIEEEKRETIRINDETRRQYADWERQARVEQRNDDAAFWMEQLRLRAAFEEEERKKIAMFWEEYRRRMQKFNEENSPSRLNFGLLR